MSLLKLILVLLGFFHIIYASSPPDLPLFQTKPVVVILSKRGTDLVEPSQIQKLVGHNILLIFASKKGIFEKRNEGENQIIELPFYADTFQLEKFIMELGKNIQILAICATSESDVLRSASIRSKLQIKGQTEHYDAEEFIDGVVFHIDGLTKNKKVLVCWPSQYVNQCISCLDGSWFGSYLLSPNDHRLQKLIDFASSVIEGMPDTSGSAFHLEVFMRGETIIFLEIASRPAEPLIRKIWLTNFGIDLVEQHIALQAGMHPHTYSRTPLRQGGFSILYSKGGMVKRALDLEDDARILLKDLWVKEGDVISSPKNLGGAIGAVAFLLTGTTSPEEEVSYWANRLASLYTIGGE